eukprot:TRINITY_DN3033_c0_g1_i1.p1 TRINITY_DN3033_c0_g1~~TRINITY_DN3033_c0_g1_i1.p1  ORF type:complete len:742 (+),score=164.33 TRINITY_DN3033_c0_g1_i1:136-2361(+)
MDGLTSCCIGRFILPSKKNRSLSLRPPGFIVYASRDDPNLDRWDQMELKFGRLLGEDPKLTLAKIMGRKSNPDISFLDIEKSFRKNKGKLVDDIQLDGSEEEQPSKSLNSVGFSRRNTHGEKLNLVRPIMKKGIKTEEVDDKSLPIEAKLSRAPEKINDKGGMSNVILRKPSSFVDDDIENEKSSKMRIKPNLFLKMRKETVEKFTDMTLLKKPEPISVKLNLNQENVSSRDSVGPSSSEVTEFNSTSGDVMEIKDEVNTVDDVQPNSLSTSAMAMNDIGGPPRNNDSLLSKSKDELKIGLQPFEQSNVGPPEKEATVTQPLDLNSVHSSITMQASLQGKPQRLDQSAKGRSHPIETDIVNWNDESRNNADEIEHFLSMPLQEQEDSDWARAEDLLKTGEREEVELISCSSRGFVASFGSLIGFLPYRNLGAKWKFLAFESWLRKKGLDPSLYKQNLRIPGSYEVQNKNLALDSDTNTEMDRKVREKLSPEMQWEDLLEAYDQEKAKFLSSFIGQRIRVNVILADRNSRRLMFSGRPKENEEVVEKKRSLMAKLNVGDVVKCCIKKITYFGIFVEVEGVPSLIHNSEVSWDATLDPSSFYKIGQIVEAKVHQLDFSLERISLSLKHISPDPLIEALESVVGDHNSLDGSLEAVQSDVEWADVQSLIKELQQIEGIQNVAKGRFFLSPGLAPTFQVYMASMFKNQYKLLARFGNKVQEVIVEASLDKEEMKDAILRCTNRVE